MINVRELRLGNYIYFDGTIHEILGVQKLSIWTKWHHDADAEKNYFEDLESYDPIPLTTEFLQVCGFEWNESINHWVISWGTNGTHFITHDLRYIGFSFQLGKGRYRIVHNLHHLQNLFYDLTDTELQIDFNSYGINKISNDTRNV